MNFKNNFSMPDAAEACELNVADDAAADAVRLSMANGLSTDDTTKLVITQLTGMNAQTLSPVAGATKAQASAMRQRDGRGRFTLGCKPGPGRPRNVARRNFVSPLSLYQRCLDMDQSVTAWKSVIAQLGPKSARAFLYDLQAEKGPVSFRHVALETIAAAEQAALMPKLPAKRTVKKPSVHRSNKKRTAKKQIDAKRLAKRRFAKNQFGAKRNPANRASDKQKARKRSDGKRKARGRVQKPMSRRTTLKQKRKAAKFRRLFKRIVNFDLEHDNDGFHLE
jgi:hypothetical protein